MQTSEHRPPPAAPVRRAGSVPHPAAVILLWLFLTIAVQSLHATALLAVAALLAAAALGTSAARLYALLRRTRWIMVALLVIYGFVTPGEALWPGAGTIGPTREGLADGALQLGRLVSALAGLSVVLATLSQRQLLAGLYALAGPLGWAGLPRQRLAVRLALTLQYAETAIADGATRWQARIEGVLDPQEAVQQDVELCIQPWRLRDIVLVAVGGGLLATVLSWAGRA